MTAPTQAIAQRGTLSALRHADFRLYFAGQLASTSGTWVQNVAQGYLVFQLTQSELWLGIVACAAGLPLIQMLPAFAAKVLHSPEDSYAAMTIAQGVGSILAGVVAGWLAIRLGRGRLIVYMLASLGVALYLFSRMTTIPLATVFCGFIGLFTVVEVISVNTMLQIVVSDQFRGRVLALYTPAFFGLAPFGSLLLGVIADRIGVQDGLALYGIAGTLCGAGIVLHWPELLREN